MKFDNNCVKIQAALDIACQYSQIEGEHHKAWCIDQMVRALLGANYHKWIEANNEWDEEEQEYTYDWDEGIAP